MDRFTLRGFVDLVRSPKKPDFELRNPEGVVLDLGSKFGADLCALICRTLEIMRVGELSKSDSVSCILSILATQMILLVESGGGNPEIVAMYVKRLIEHYKETGELESKDGIAG